MPGQLWPFLCIHSSKLGQKQSKRTWRRRGPFAKTSRRKEDKLCTTLPIKWFSNVRRSDLVGNNSRMSIDRPKPANSNTRRIVYAKVGLVTIKNFVVVNFLKINDQLIVNFS